MDKDDEHSGFPRLRITRTRALTLVVVCVGTIAFIYVLMPQVAGLQDAWVRMRDADPVWLAAALVFEVLSMASYILFFQAVCVPRGSSIRWRESTQITLAGLAATRVFAAGGAGGIALTVWALLRSGMRRAEVAERMVGFLVLLYGVYLAALVLFGVGLYTGVLPGAAPAGMTLVPAGFGAVAIAIALALAYVPGQRDGGAPRRNPVLRWLAKAGASMAAGVRFAVQRTRHPDAALVGAITWWAFNIAVLWAVFEALGASPTFGVLVLSYFVGMLANLIPVPGGVGAVDGGMIGALVGFGVDASLAVGAVLGYRLFAFWLPTLPGVVAYLQLRRTVATWTGPRPDTLTSGSERETIAN